MSSISPCRQLRPSILEIDAMLPAPKAALGEGRSTRATRHTRRMYFAPAMFWDVDGDMAEVTKSNLTIISSRVVALHVHDS